MTRPNRPVRPLGRASSTSGYVIRRACRPIVEMAESRILLSFSGSLSGLPTAITSDSYTLYATTTGSTSASSETFHFGDGYSTTVSSPSDPQAANHAYGSPTTYTPTANITPSGGSAITVPLTLDSTFGNSPTYSGKTVANSYGNTGLNGGTAMAIDPYSGNIYVAAPYDETSTTSEFAVTSFQSNGSLNADFNSTGTATVGFDSGKDVPVAIAVDGSGNVVVAGNCATGFAVARFTSTGSLDSSFGSDGVLSGFLSGTCTGMIIDSSGNIVLCGYTGSPSEFVAFRLTYNGDIDTSFGTLGKKTVAFSGSSNSGANAIVQENFGNEDYILGGWSCQCSGSQEDFALAALSDTNGSLDTGFNSTGMVTTNLGLASCCTASSDADYALVSDGNNSRIIAAGGTYYASQNAFGIAVYTSSGALDTTFNTHGVKVVDIGTSATAYSVDLQSDGQIVAAGTASGVTGMTGTGSDFAVVRLSGSSGAPDSNFGASGVAVTDFNAAADTAYAVKVDSDGTILAAGNSGGDIALARYLADNYVTVSDDDGMFRAAAAGLNAGLSDPSLAAAPAVPPADASALDPLDGIDSSAAYRHGHVHRPAIIE